MKTPIKKITIKVPEDVAAEFNAAVKRRCTTQKKAFEVMLRDWLHPSVALVRKLDDELPEFPRRWFNWRNR